MQIQALRISLLISVICLHIPGAYGQKVEVFDVSADPRPADWQRFFKMPAEKRQELWRYFAKQAKPQTWAWGWRVGWLRACAKDQNAYCQGLLKRGLEDPALVVRAEAADSIGKRYEGSKDTKMIKALRSAFANKQNYRRGEPLFVQQRILHALKKIGGADALATGKALARKDPQSKNYWQKLTRM